MNISLTSELEEFVDRKVKSGRYSSASEVIREGLRLLEERDRTNPSFIVSSLEELQQKVEEGLHSLNRGETSSRTAEDIIAEGRAKLAELKTNG